MEEEKGPLTPPSPGSRWNPTREQIAILEGIYRQGIRTPSAEQIQRITGRLREFGSIEGKNVFYWFQNHKARQRQKQKQESYAYFSRLLHRPPPPLLSPPPPPPPQHRPPFPPQPCTNVVCSPFLLPVPQVGGDGLYQPQFHNVFLPGAVRWRPRAELQRMETGAERTLEADHNVPSRPGYYYDPVLGAGGGDAGGACSETLQLFPLHPTGILDDERPGSSLPWVSAGAEGGEDGEEGEGGENPPFINFLG